MVNSVEAHKSLMPCFFMLIPIIKALPVILQKVNSEALLTISSCIFYKQHLRNSHLCLYYIGCQCICLGIIVLYNPKRPIKIISFYYIVSYVSMSLIRQFYSHRVVNNLLLALEWYICTCNGFMLNGSHAMVSTPRV